MQEQPRKPSEVQAYAIVSHEVTDGHTGYDVIPRQGQGQSIDDVIAALPVSNSNFAHAVCPLHGGKKIRLFEHSTINKPKQLKLPNLKRIKLSQAKEDTLRKRTRDIQRLRHGLKEQIKDPIAINDQIISPRRTSQFEVHNSLAQSDSEVEVSRNREARKYDSIADAHQSKHSHNLKALQGTKGSFLARLRKKHRVVMSLDSLDSPRSLLKEEDGYPPTNDLQGPPKGSVLQHTLEQTHRQRHSPSQPVKLNQLSWDFGAENERGTGEQRRGEDRDGGGRGTEEDVEQFNVSYALPRIEEILRAEGIKPQSISQQIERLKERCHKG